MYQQVIVGGLRARPAFVFISRMISLVDFDQRLERFRPASGRDNRVSSVKRSPGDRLTEPRRGSGDQPHLGDLWFVIGHGTRLELGALRQRRGRCAPV